MVETALSLLVVTTIVFGTMEFARLTYAYNFVGYAAQEAVRYASVRGSASGDPATQDSVTRFVRAQAIGLIASDLVVKTSWPAGNEPGNTVNVQVTYNLPGVVGSLLPATSTVSGTAQMVITQ
ncbi:MAG: TadE family protein [Bryobacteraceae bacterium]